MASGTCRVAVAACVVSLMCSIAAAQVPHSSHVWVVTEENRSYEDVVSSMPYLMSLANQYGLATQYYADMHNSLSALMHLTAGQTITLNDDTTLTFNTDNLVREMLPLGLTFKSYQEELPYAGFLGLSYEEYVKRHNPLVYFSDVANSSLKYDSVPFSQLASDLASGATANFNYITPDLLDDAHDGTMQQADYWLSQHIPAIMARPEFQAGGDGLMFLVFDEGNISGDSRCSATISSGCGGRTATVVVGPRVKRGFQSSTWYDHESLLKTVCLALGVANCPGYAKNARPMADFFGTPPSTEPMNMVLTSPIAGGSSSSTVSVAGCATSKYPITGWYIYVDSVTAWHTSNWVQCINTSVSAGAGTHTLTVRAWDNTGAYTSQYPTVTVSAPITVKMSSPYDGETVGPYVQVIASATSNNPITGWVIYVDGVSVWRGGAVSSVNQWIGITPGTHQFVVRAWDSTGAYASGSAKVYLP